MTRQIGIKAARTATRTGGLCARTRRRIAFGCGIWAVFATCAVADLSENFDASTAVPAGWIDGGTANDNVSTHYQSAPNCRALGSNDTLQTPLVDNPTNLSFYVDCSNGTKPPATVDYSLDGTAWVQLGSFAVSTAGSTKNFPLTAAPDLSMMAGVRFRFNSTFNTWYLDNVAIQTGSSATSNGPPVLSLNPTETNRIVLVGEEVRITVGAVEADGDEITLSGINLPAGAAFEPNPRTGLSPLTNVFAWTPLSTGVFSMAFAAGDKDGTNQVALRLSVFATDPDVLLSENFDVSASVPVGWTDGGTTNDTVSGHPGSAPNCRAFGTNDTLTTPAVDYPTNLSFYVDASSGGDGKTAWVSYRIGSNDWVALGSFVARSAGATASFSLLDLPGVSTGTGIQFQFSSTFNTWYLDDVLVRGGRPRHLPPTLSPIGNQVVAAGRPLEFAVQATDVDGDEIALWAADLPPGALFAGATNAGSVSGAFSFAAAPEQIGNAYTTTFYAADVNGTNRETIAIGVFAHLAGFSSSEFATNEGGGILTVDVQLDAAADATVRVAVAGSAAQGADYELSATDLVFTADGPTVQTLSITLMDDAVPEADETLRLAIVPPDSFGAGPIAEYALTLLDDDAIFEENFDANPYWTTSWQWAFGVPRGLGGSTGNPDPTSGHTGTNVYGYNLTGDYYSPMVTAYYLTTPAIDCSGFRNVKLSFWRWLGIEEGIFDQVSVQASRDGKLWRDVWVHNGAAISDSAWRRLEYDISAIAEDQETVYVRWGMGPTDVYLAYCGWNIDDVAIDGVLIEEPVVKFREDTFAVREGAGTAIVAVVRSGPIDAEVRVDYTTSNGTAVAGADYVAATGTLVFAAGVVSNFFEVPISADELVEGNETLTVHLAGVSTNARLGAVSAATLTIADDNAPQASFPFIDGFEAGAYSNCWKNAIAQSGRIRLTSSLTPAAAGSYQICMDSAANYTFGYSELVLNVDLSGQTNVYLDFWERLLDGYLAPMPEHFIGTVKADGVAISADGVNWYRLYNVYSYPYYYAETNYQRQVCNLSEVAAANGLEPGPHFKIKFQQNGLYQYPYAGRCLDNVMLYDGAATADLALQMADAPDPCTVGSNLTYVLRATNAGPAVALGATVASALPPLADFVSATSTAGTCTFESGVVTCVLGELPPGATALVEIVVQPNGYGVLTNSAALSSATFDPLGSNNLAAVETVVDPPGGDLQFGTAAYELREDRSSVWITVTRTNRTYGEIAVDFAASGGTAAAGSDYAATNGTLVLPSGVVSGSFRVDVINDGEPEAEETIQLVLSNAAGGATLSAPAAAVVTIRDDDGSAAFPMAETFESGQLTNYWSTYSSGDGRIEIATDYSPCGGSRHLTMDAESYGNSLNELVLTIDLAGQTGVTLAFSQKEFNDEDHQMPAAFAGHNNSDGVALSADGTNWFKVQGLTASEGSGNSCSAFEIPLDALLAANGLSYADRFKIKFQQYDNYPINTDGMAFDDIRVFSAKGSLRFSASTYAAEESAAAATVRVERVGGALGEVSVQYATADGTATAGADYAETTGTLFFANGVVTGSFVVALSGDAEDEPAETVLLALREAGGGATLAAPSNAVLTLIDDDGFGEFAFEADTVTATESNAAVLIAVRRLGGAEGEVSVDYATHDGTASNGLDYLEAAGTLVFADGEIRRTFAVPLLDDAELEDVETVFLSLGNPGGGAGIGEPAAATLRIVDDEDPNFDYYAPAYGKEGAELRQALHDVIDDHVAFGYDTIWTILQEIDECPTNSSQVQLVYMQTGRDKNNNGGNLGQWNREHVWPQSHGFPDALSTAVPPSVDAHNLRPSDVAVNALRGEKDFDAGGAAIEGTPPTCLTTADTFEPPDASKGDVARAMFYMDVRYAGDKDGEPDLQLVDAVNTSGTQLGKLSTLIRWHFQDPPDDFEQRRNNLIYTNWQGNRNPFVDHPEWVLKVWEYNMAIATTAGAGGGIAPANPQVPYHSDQFFEIQPAPYWHVADVRTNGVSMGADYGTSSFSFVWGPIVATGTLEAVFAENLTAAHGVPEWWLAAHGVTNDFAAAELDDPDEDGAQTWQEFAMDTDPFDPDSVLRVEALEFALDAEDAVVGYVLGWPAATGRVYDVECLADLAGDVWLPLDGRTNLASDAGYLAVTNAFHDGRFRMLRLQVRRP